MRSFPTEFVKDYGLAIAEGKAPGAGDNHKFGRNAAVGTTPEAIWTPGGSFPWLTAGASVEVAAGGDAADGPGGVGTRKIYLEGIAPDWYEASAEITTNGISASASPSQQFIRINRAFGIEQGVYRGVNTADITIKVAGGGTTLAVLPAGKNQTQMAVISVPLKKRGYIWSILATVASGKTANVQLWRCDNADSVVAPFTSSSRIQLEWDGVVGAVPLNPKTPLGPFPPKTDLWFEAFVATTAASVSIDYEVVFVDHEY